MDSTIKNIIFRADGNAATGLGHIMRSAGLMQWLQEAFACSFMTRNPEYFPAHEFSQPPVVIAVKADTPDEDARAVIAQATAGDIVVLDGYQFQTAYQQQLKQADLYVVCITDDIAACHYVADVLINHAGGISPELYSHEPYTRLCLGPEYALVKPLFYQHPRPVRDFTDRQVLVSLGGADPCNGTGQVLEQLLEINSFSQIHVVLGAANQYRQELKAHYGNRPGLSFYETLKGQELYELMRQCPYAVLAPSTVCYEYMTLGGCVFLYQIADNQTHIKSYMLSAKLAYDFSNIKQNPDCGQVSGRQNEIFDRLAPKRLLHLFQDIEGSDD